MSDKRFGLVRSAADEAVRLGGNAIPAATPKPPLTPLAGGQSLRRLLVEAVGPKAVELGERRLRRLRM